MKKWLVIISFIVSATGFAQYHSAEIKISWMDTTECIHIYRDAQSIVKDLYEKNYSIVDERINELDDKYQVSKKGLKKRVRWASNLIKDRGIPQHVMGDKWSLATMQADSKYQISKGKLDYPEFDLHRNTISIMLLYHNPENPKETEKIDLIYLIKNDSKWEVYGEDFVLYKIVLKGDYLEQLQEEENLSAIEKEIKERGKIDPMDILGKWELTQAFRVEYANGNRLEAEDMDFKKYVKNRTIDFLSGRACTYVADYHNGKLVEKDYVYYLEKDLITYVDGKTKIIYYIISLEDELMKIMEVNPSSNGKRRLYVYERLLAYEYDKSIFKIEQEYAKKGLSIPGKVSLSQLINAEGVYYYIHPEMQEMVIPYTGIIEDVNAEGRVLRKASVDNGKLVGEYLEWHENTSNPKEIGLRKLRMAFENGNPIGGFEAWNENGTYKTLGYYTIEGKQGKFYYFNEHGQFISVEEFSNGKLKNTKTYQPDSIPNPVGNYYRQVYSDPWGNPNFKINADHTYTYTVVNRFDKEERIGTWYMDGHKIMLEDAKGNLWKSFIVTDYGLSDAYGWVYFITSKKKIYHEMVPLMSNDY